MRKPNRGSSPRESLKRNRKVTTLPAIEHFKTAPAVKIDPQSSRYEFFTVDVLHRKLWTITWPGLRWRPRQAALVRARFTVTRRQNLHQRRQAMAQALDTVRGRMGRAVRIVRARSDAIRQVGGMIVHLLEQVTDQGTRVLGMKPGVPFQGAQQLLPDRVVVRMATGAQACLVQRLGPPVKSAEQWPPIDNIRLRGFTTSSDAAAVER